MTIADTIKKQEGAGFSLQEIRRNLLSQGYSLDEVNTAMQIVYDEKEAAFASKHNILSHKYTPLVLIAFNYILFFHLVPIRLAEAHSTMFGVVGGVIMLILTFWASAVLTPRLLDKHPIGVLITSILTPFVFGVAFVSMTSGYASRELQENGVMANAKIVDMTKIYVKGGNFLMTMRVIFKTKENIAAEAEIDLTDDEYDSFEEGMEIPVIYSSRNTGIARVAYSQAFQRYRQQ